MTAPAGADCPLAVVNFTCVAAAAEIVKVNVTVWVTPVAEAITVCEPAWLGALNVNCATPLVSETAEPKDVPAEANETWTPAKFVEPPSVTFTETVTGAPATAFTEVDDVAVKAPGPPLLVRMKVPTTPVPWI